MGLLKRIKYKLEMSKERRYNEDIIRAAKTERRYAALAKAEKAKAAFESARTRTYKARAARTNNKQGFGTGFLGGLAGGNSAALNALVGDFNMPKKPKTKKTKKTKNQEKTKKTKNQEKTIYDLF